jgi:hypothetical protein
MVALLKKVLACTFQFDGYRNWDDLVTIVTAVRAVQPRSNVLIPGKGVQTGSGIHLLYYAMGTSSSFPGDKVAEA